MLCVTGSVRSAGDTQPLRAAGGVAAGPAYLVLDSPRHMVLATRPARSDVAEFGARIWSVAPSGPCSPAARARKRASMSAPVERRAQAPGNVGLEDYLKFK